ncbi:DUF6457 domain-containing protein [Gryllotalpicola reticulitermitis]|uniref:DUF6457 domain-containing protein n=1 Tax=Gryllotalpicola reticulitermitis TaxID=1184153 RepID=A0ABV8Q6M5_9MICO
MSEQSTPSALDEWLAEACRLLGITTDPRLSTPLLLDVAARAAHTVVRPAAPITTFLVGLAAGRVGGSDEDVARAVRAILAGLEAWEHD